MALSGCLSHHSAEMVVVEPIMGVVFCSYDRRLVCIWVDTLWELGRGAHSGESAGPVIDILCVHLIHMLYICTTFESSSLNRHTCCYLHLYTKIVHITIKNICTQK